MMYQWRTPYVLDATKYRARFGAEPTPLATVLRDTFAWASAEYARPLLKAS